MREIILLAHGSPDPRSGAAMKRFAERIQGRVELPTSVAFLDHEGPNLAEASKELGAEETLVVPMLLSNAFHARFDVPKALREAGLQRALPPIGNPSQILRHLIQKAGSDVVVVAAGSSDAKARDAFKASVDLASAGHNQRVDVAFVTGSEKSFGSQLAAAEDPSAVTVIPWLLAQGRLLDAVLTQAIQHRAAVQGNGLVEETTFVEYLSSTIQLSLQSESYPLPTMAR